MIYGCVCGEFHAGRRFSGEGAGGGGLLDCVKQRPTVEQRAREVDSLVLPHLILLYTSSLPCRLPRPTDLNPQTRGHKYATAFVLISSAQAHGFHGEYRIQLVRASRGHACGE